MEAYIIPIKDNTEFVVDEVAKAIFKDFIASNLKPEDLGAELGEIKTVMRGFARLSYEAAEALQEVKLHREYEAQSVLNASLKEIQASLK